MALINCPECNKEISDSVDVCIHCGYKISKTQDKKGKVIIHSYNEMFLVNPSVKIYQNDQYITEISRSQTIELPVDSDSIFTFKSSIRKVDVHVSKNNLTEIMLSFNRGTGSLQAITNIQTSDAVSNQINQAAYNNTLKQKNKSNIIWLIIGIVCLILGIILFN